MTDILKYAIGIDLGGTTVKFAVVSSDGSVLFADKLPTKASEGAEQIISQIKRGLDITLKFIADKGIKVEGVGFGTPGIVSSDGTQIIGGTENLVGWENIAISDVVKEHTGLECLADNDANLMALGETMYGASRSCSDVVFLTVGTGIGGGILIDGKLYSGYRRRGGELGHISIKYDGDRCACGSVGCFEHYASTSALIRHYVKLTGESEVDGELIVKRYFDGEKSAVEVMTAHWAYLASGIASLIHIFAPERVVIGGGISEAGQFYIDELRKVIAPILIDVCSDHTQIVAAELGNSAGVLGAAGLMLK